MDGFLRETHWRTGGITVAAEISRRGNLASLSIYESISSQTAVHFNSVLFTHLVKVLFVHLMNVQSI